MLGLLLGATGPAMGAEGAAVAAGPTGPVHTIGGVGYHGYQVPHGWTLQESPGLAKLIPPPEAQVDPNTCTIMLTPPLNSRDYLGKLARQLLAASLEKLFGAIDPSTLTRYDGVSGKGWTDTDLYGRLGSGRLPVHAHVLMAHMSAELVFPVVGVTSEYDNCLNGQDHATWVVLFHSLRIPGYTADSPWIAQQIVGTWEHFGGRFFQSDSYLKNGDFGEFRSCGTWTASDFRPNRLLLTTQDYPNNGRFEIHGDECVKSYRKGGHGGESTARQLVSIVRKTDAKTPSGGQWILRVVNRYGPDQSPRRANLGIESFTRSN